ncbi:uncharacterized protein BP5553_00199 [Venustampulla echinocandica]|uniref:Carrier domain-containing protein n=1 Tax=Venustampulla echinocandica TaxID=2656787 RepID=A0A370TXH9_9HELO|nr:uncharacterized protein BP5553_00199 [Venustampulla echinocandica]RDL40220.1 hypothetical protein BP5553_00199 [Venustampulla echinocandica]
MASSLTKRRGGSDTQAQNLYLDGAVPCQFANFEGGTYEGDGHLSAYVELEDSEDTRSLLAGDPKITASVLKLVWGLVLRCYTGQDDVCFAYQEFEDSKAALNMLLARIAFDETTNIQKMVQKIQHAHQENAQDCYSESLKHMCNTALLLKDYKGLTPGVASLHSFSQFPEHYSLLLELQNSSSGPKLYLHYRTDRSSMEQARNIASTGHTVLREIARRPDSCIGNINYVSQFNMERLWDWNSRALEAVESCIHDVIRDQAVARPHAEAVCDKDGSLSYYDLDKISSRLAMHLTKLKIGPGMFVLLCLHKSIWNVVSMLAVLKTGAAFVPLDPAAPMARLQALSTSVGSSFVICSQQFAHILSSVVENVIPIDGEMIGQLPDSQLVARLPKVQNTGIAYMIFTSGTTGMPKGTMIEHRAFCSSAKYHAHVQLMNSESRVLQFAAHTFDASLVEILTTLMVGGVVCIPSEDERLNMITEAINAMKVNWAVLTPSFVGFIDPADVPGLKTLVLAGEAMSESHIATWSKINLVNGYGPSECSVCAVANSCVTTETSPTNIGWPVGVHTWVVDRYNHDNLVPIGCVGELLIQGPTLARGYHNQPDKTAESFVPPPSWDKQQKWPCYKTGDLVRQNIDGSLSFAGRKDTQVKVHGQRVELGEIEAHLNVDEDVKHALVLLPKIGKLNRRLITVLSLSDCHAVDGDERVLCLTTEQTTRMQIVRERLQSQLPIHMVPTTWLVVGAIPLLPSGKLDRKRVATWVDSIDDYSYRRVVGMAATTLPTEESATKAATEIETKLREIWSHVLNVDIDQVGLDSKFTGLGGDSISAMLVKGQCAKKDISLTVQEILRSTSITQLAQCAKAVDRPSYHEELIEHNFDLSPIQQMFFKLPNQGKTHFNQSFFLRVAHKIQMKHLQTAIETLVKRHSMLRARFSYSDTDNKWQQRLTENISGSYRLRAYEVDDPKSAEPAIADSQKSLNIVSGPLFAADLFDVAGSDQLLFMVANHLAIDLVSWRVILEEIEELLLDPELASIQTVEKPLSFQTWCQIQAEHSQKIKLDTALPIDVPSSEESYWGMPEGSNTYGNVITEGFEVDSVTTAKMLTQCHDALRTEPIDVLLSSLIYSFARSFNDRSTPAIYNEGHGRDAENIPVDLSRTVGWFTIMYPVHVPQSAVQDIVALVREVKDLRRRVPDNGRQYFASRNLTSQGHSRYNHHWPLEIAFNYLGQYQQLERKDSLLRPVEAMAGEARGAGGSADVGEDTPRFGLFEISAVIIQGKLRFSFTFNRHMKQQDKIRQWIWACQQTVGKIAETLMRAEPQATLGDFPLLSVSNDGLKTMVTERLPSIGISKIDDVEEIYPCSAIQDGLLISQNRSDAFYAIQVSYELRVLGDIPVDGKRLGQAWQRVVDRHPALRTVFIESVSDGDGDGLYDQVVLKHISADISNIRCSNANDALRVLGEKDLVSYINTHQPPHRFTVCEAPDGKVFCKLDISHAILDGTSMSILFQELAAAYEGLLSESTGTPYSRYIAYLQSLPRDMSIAYWMEYLSGIEPCIFPVLNDGQSVARELHTRRLQFKQSQFIELQKLCQNAGATLSNVFHTAWALTLRCFTGSDDPCFGYLTSGRDAPVDGLENAVGVFINMLVCRVGIAPVSRLGAILDQVQKDYLDSLPHRETSLAEIQHALKLGNNHLFNTALSYRKLPKEPASRPNVSFSECIPIYDPTEYSVSLNIEASDNNIAIDLDYWTDHISDDQANNVGSTFLKCLQNVISSSDHVVDHLDFVSGENCETIQKWNCQMPVTIDDCVHKIIERKSDKQPNSPAISAWDAEFTYAELNNLATRLALHLVKMGVAPGTFVLTCFDKSGWTVVAMLAVLKAGAGAVPLDATYPASAVELRLRETKADIVLVSPQRVSLFADMNVHAVVVDKANLEQMPYGELRSSVGPGDPCFIIFTSGSTGTPKGVVLEHRAISSSAHATGSVYGWGSHSRVLQFASYTFDNSLAEIFITLTRGGCVCVPSEHERFNSLAETVNKLRVNFMDITPTVATFLRPSDVPTVKGLSLGGEPLTKENIEVWGKAVALHCCYGPSECSINSVWNGDLCKSMEATNIGRAIGSISWIVDPSNHNRLTPIGCVGELLIEGPILARGYLNDPEKTSNSFIEQPAWAPGNGRRMYKTGDLVRYNSDGSITYLGRKDTQVKLNGQRLELGEIEHHVKQNLPSEAQSGVELISFGPEGKATKAITAFFSLESYGVPTAGQDDLLLDMSQSVRSMSIDLQAAISNAVPAYMVPSVFIPVKALPMTSSGKLDRRRLRIIGSLLSEDQVAMYRLSGTSGRAPSTEMEQVMSKLWGFVLNIDSNLISAEDNFFGRGGDSVGAMKLISAARGKGISLTVANVFQKPTLLDLAADATTLPGTEISNILSVIKPFSMLRTDDINKLILEISTKCRVEAESIEDIYPCTALQEGLVSLSNKDPGAYVAQNIYRLAPSIDLDRFRAAWQRVVEAEVILRTRVVYTEFFGFLQVVVREPITWHQAGSLTDLGEVDRQLPAYNGGILSRYTITGEAKNDPHFVWTAHHALYDGWCIPIMLERVEACYYDIKSADLMTIPTYSQFIKYHSEIDKDSSDTFWRSRLSEPISTHFPALPNPAYQVHATSLASSTTHITQPDTRITLPTTIRAAWALVVAVYSGSPKEVVFGEILSGRDAPVPGIEDLIGPTLATVPTRILIDPDTRIMKFLEDLQAYLAEAVPYQFAGLQNIKQLSEDAAITCGFQNLLAINHDSQSSESGFWNLQSSGTVGTNFMSYPLTVSCQIAGSKVELEATYDHHVISTWLIDNMLRQFDFVLGLLNSPDIRRSKLGQITLLNPGDEKKILSWNGEPTHPVNECVHNLIVRQVLSRPGPTVAVDGWDATFTYQQLDDISTRLAVYLAKQGVKGTFVPLFFEKSSWTIVAMLAVLKCGAAFVPLDVGAPVARLQDIIQDTQPKVALCSSRLQTQCASLVARSIGVDCEMLERLPDEGGPLSPGDHNSVAYLIYTSGSTGKPKGTIINHSAFCAGALAHGAAQRMGPTSRVLQFASYTFDASLLEILTTLIVGGTVCVPSEESRINTLAKVMNDMSVTWALLTPSVTQLLQPSEVPTLRILVLGGEAMSQSHISKWADNLELINAYGPSECSVVATVNPHMSMSTEPNNMGRAVGGRAWITDVTNYNRLAPVGSIGELVIEGPILSQGYLKNDAKTAESFIEGPEWAHTNITQGAFTKRRMYRTGDLVKYTPDGNLLFCGRKDTQAKLHGQRLELGEVEHHLRMDASIQHALAIIPKSGYCSKRLVAILSLQEPTATSSTTGELGLVVREAGSFNLNAIRERLCSHLPSYMIPSNWVILEKLPLLPSGKLDGRKIQRWVEQMSAETYQQISDIESENDGEAGTVIERRLQNIWAAALNLPASKIGLRSSFYHLGGDSITAMQVMSTCRAENLGVTVRDIIRSKSISQLALLVTLPEVEQSSIEEQLESLFDLSPIQKLYFECVGSKWAHFNQSVMVRLARRIETKELALAIESIMLSHSMLRARFSKNEAGEWQQRIMQNVSNAYRFNVITTTTDKVASVVEASQKGLDIQNGPTFAVDLFEIENEDYQLVSLVAHHLVIDVVSWRVILQDLEDVLNTGALKLQSSLPFQTWCHLQVEDAASTMSKTNCPLENVPVADLNYWDMAGKSNVYGDTVEGGFEINPETSLLLLGTCHDSLQTEPVDVFLAATLQSFRRVFPDRSSTPAIYNEGHGREPWDDTKLDISRTVGWFTTMCPIFLPSNIEGDTDLMSTIRWTKDLRSRIPAKGRPYFAHRLLTEEGRQQFSSHWPMEITFNYLGKLQQLERKDALLQPVEGATNTDFDTSPDVPRFALIEISAAVTNGAIKISFSYNRHMKRQAKIRRWIVEFKRFLQDAAKQLMQSTQERTLSDFPLLPLAYNGMANLTKKRVLLGISTLDEIEDVYPCAPTQTGMLLAQLKNPNLYAYSAVFEVRPSQPGLAINTQLLAEAWQAVVRRHATLRTVFIDSICQSGLTDQVVLKDRIARITWLECEDSEILSTLDAQTPLNFHDFQPPHRLTICTTNTNRIFCQLEMSHAISDGTSIPILLRDISNAYKDSSLRDFTSLISYHEDDDLSISKPKSNLIGPLYSEYIAHIQSSSFDQHINYWKVYLDGIEPCHLTSLNDGIKEKELQSVVLNITQEHKLRNFCAQNGLSLSNVLQLVWAMILRCYTGSDEVCFGYLTSGRDAPIRGIQDAAVGAFVNMLICRINLTDSFLLGQALEKIQMDFVNSMAHQSCSLADVQHELGLSGTSLFNTAFAFQNRSNMNPSDDSPFIFDVVDAHDPSEYDVTVNVEALDSRVEVHFGYWTTVLSASQAANIAATFEHIVDTIISDKHDKSDRTIADLDFFSSHSRQQVLQWNQTLPPKVENCIHDMVRQHALTRPKRTPAITAWDSELSYHELDSLATRLAGYLVEQGVGEATHVPLCFDKSGWAVVSMIAVMKAGGTIVPLDHTHPEGRLQQFINDVDATLVLCSQKNQEKIASIAKQAIVINRCTMERLSKPSKAPILPTITSDHSAYIIFTSGTTGRPKGTIIEHGAFCTSAIEHSKAMFMRSDSRVFQFASYTFDASIMEILSTLIVGGCVCVPSEQERFNDIPGAINRMGVTWTLLTPAVASTLSPESVPGLKVLVTGGEAMSSGHISKWKGKTGLVNAYGPSETSVIATTSTKVDEVGNEVNTDPGNIGRAVGGRTWVVDPRNYNKLVPIGGIGELVVEGRTVARGYLNNEQKTSEVFIDNPVWLNYFEEKERVYRTGDIVRYNSNGTLSFVARKDTQIKLNGQRIELGEIEHHVATILPGDCQSCVDLISPTNRVASKALAVFFSSSAINSASDAENCRVSGADDILLTMSDTARSTAKNLDSSLAAVLPTYMIPSIYIPVTKMPWTSSGKLDRARLRNIVHLLPKEVMAAYRLAGSDSKGKITPTSLMEKKLQKLWETVLTISQPGSVGSEDNFFRLGGDSISAMRLVSSAKKEGISISVVDIFRNPKLCDMALTCGAAEEQVQSELGAFSLMKGEDSIANIMPELVEQCRLNEERIQDAFPTSRLQQGLLTLSTKSPGAYTAKNAFLLPADLDLDRFKNAWQTVISEVEILRTRIVHMKSSAFVQVVIEDEPIRWKVAPNLQTVQDAPTRLPKHNGGLLTEYTITDQLDNGERYFIWSIHHALYDGWSLPMVLKRVELVYADGAASFSKTPYSLFIKWLSEVDEQASDEFWRRRLSGSSPLVFPQGQHTVSGDSQNNQTLCHTASISRRTASTGITVPTIIRAAWALIVASYSGSDDVIFGETLAGRDIPVQGIADMIGPTITTVPTRIQVQQYLKAINFLQEIQKMATDVIPYQHAGLQRIKRLNSDAESACDFQNLLVIQNAEEEVVDGIWNIQDNGPMDNFFTYPLVIECKGSQEKVRITAHYDTNSISTWEVQRIMHQLDYVLKQLSDLPKHGTSMTLSDIQVFSPQDNDLVRDWNRTRPQFIESCIHDEFEEIAECQPNAPAVSAWDGDFTYAEIRDHATRLAQHLVTLGVQSEQFIPICMDKSAWVIVAMLGIFMAGGAYMPLDPSAPISRHKEMIQDVNPFIILCSPKYSESYDGIVQKILSISGETISNLPKRDSIHELHRANSRNAAYVIFTSGSTGRPKGTVVEHRSISTSCVAMRRSLLMKPTSRVFQFASFTFDVSILEIFTTLTYGGCVCIPSEGMRTRDVAEAIRSLDATWAFLTPSVANLVEPSKVPSLEVLVCGGEAMSIENVVKWADKVILVNGYGPTEASIIAVANPIVSKQKDPTNIGRALSSGLTWIVDPHDHNRITPVGCVGELLLDGPLLAREYLNNKSKTDEAFVKQPAWTDLFEHLQLQEPNQPPSFHSTRMYRTGDLVKYSQDGSLIFIGRKDNQVKLHGQRMEPGEIEHALDLDSEVQHALVALPKSGPFRKRLVAIVSLDTLSSSALAKGACELILHGPNAATAHTYVAGVRDRLSLILPPYMIPSSWLVVWSIPLLPSGKLDRRKVESWLASIDDETYQQIIDAEDEVDKAMPVTETGKLLQDIFSRVLNLPAPQVKLSQSFLHLGGDSISAMQVMALCRKANINFSLSQVLKSTSIHQLASISRHEDAVQHQQAIFDQDFDLSPIQQLYIQSQKASSYVGEARFNQSFSLAITRHVRPQDLESAIQQIVDQHSMLRARFVKSPAGVWQQRLITDTYSSYRYRTHQVDDESHLPGLVAESQSCLDIEKGPLFVVDLVNISGMPQMIFLAAHHLIIDMVSWRIVLADLEEILNTGTLSSQPTLSFQVWCNLQAERSLKDSNINQATTLPSAIAAPNTSFWGMDSRENTYEDVVREAFTINKTITNLAMTQSHRALKTEPLDIFLSAIAHSFSRVFVDRATPAVFNESHGREPWNSSIDLSRTVGWFTTIAPIHADVDLEEDDVVDTVRRIKDNRRILLENGRPYFAHQYLTPDGRGQLQGHGDTMEIIFNYLGRMQQLEHSDALLQQWTYPEDEQTSKTISDVGNKATRFALFEISAAIVEDEIQFSFLYNKQMCHQHDIKRWVSECQETLEEIVQRLSCPTLDPSFTLSDFPLLPISYDDLEKIVKHSLPEVEDIFPAAPLQEGLILSQLKDPSLYHFHAIMEVLPADDLIPIDGQRLAEAWQRVVDYHPSLRTVFADSVYKGDIFNQIVVKKVDSGIALLRCDGGEHEAVQQLSPMSILDFNYKKQPRLPHQAFICETSSGKVYLKAEVNHGVIDGASVNIMLRDLAMAYHGTLPEESAPLYSEYVAYVKSQPAGAGLTFWGSYLEGARTCLFPTLRAQPPYEKKLGSLWLRFDRFSELQDMCKNMKITFATAVQAAWAFCLRLYTNSDDVSFGYLTSGRDVPVKGIQDTMGAFINMLVCRVKFSNESTLKELFDKVQNDFIDFLDHQHCSLARVQHEITGGKALFNTAMSIQGDSASDKLESTSINFTPVAAHDPSEAICGNY